MVGPKPMLSLGFSINLRVVHPSNRVLIDGRSSRNVNAFSLQDVVDYMTKKIYFGQEVNHFSFFEESNHFASSFVLWIRYLTLM